MLKKLGEMLLDLVFPPKCIFCGRVTEDKTFVCKYCERDIPRTSGGGQTQKLAHIEQCVSPLYYEGRVRESLLRYKFKDTKSYGRIYASLVRKCIDENNISCDIITWVPLSRKRLRSRGYNQSELIGRRLGSELGIPCMDTLKKKKSNKTQSTLKSEEERKRNVKDVYLLAGADITGKSVLIIDDIVTTGATLSECGKMLRKGGAKHVYAAAVARKRT